MLRSEMKSILILTLFSYLMWDYLTIATIGFSSLGLVLIALNFQLSKMARTVIALGVFASYVLVYGKVIDPEVGLNFLTSVVILKLLEKENLRDSYMIFFGLILLLSAGTLFEKTLTYVFFFTSSFLILLFDFYGTLLIKSRARDLFLGFLWVIPLTCVLFFAVPRIVSPLAFRSGSPGAGEVGYTPNLRISEVESLEMNDEPVFQALVENPLPMEKLYWRGNVLAQTDGWNWTSSHSDHLFLPPEKTPEIGPGSIRQKIRVFAKEPYLFALDSARKFILGKHVVVPDDFHVLQQSGTEWNPRYEVISRMEDIPAEKDVESKYLKVILPKKLREWIDVTFPSRDLAGLEREIGNYYKSEGFSYSLKPGKIINFREFMRDKKTGFCAHYASATAMILRSRGIPVRLVSGFMGGNYNAYADFYLVTQNDAHVWIEAFESGKWVRLDPTAWIAPERLTMGGEVFLGTVAAGRSNNPLSQLRFNFRWVREASLWLNQWDFKFYQWLEEMDYYGQEAMLSRFKFKRRWLYTLAPLMIAFFLGLFIWQTRRREETLGMSLHERVWKEFVEKVHAKGLLLIPVSIEENEKRLSGWNHPEREHVTMIWAEMIRLSFRDDGDWGIIRKKIRKL
jgi:hypothetical protein